MYGEENARYYPLLNKIKIKTENNTYDWNKSQTLGYLVNLT